MQNQGNEPPQWDQLRAGLRDQAVYSQELPWMRGVLLGPPGQAEPVPQQQGWGQVPRGLRG